MARTRPRLSPQQFLGFTIAGLILVGGLLLRLPVSAAAGQHITLLDAMFTATSAVCVTGLIVRDTAQDFSIFGQIVVMLLIQAGGLGYMTLSTVLIAALGRTVTLQERLTLQEALNVQSLEGLVRFARTVFRFTLFFELSGTAILASRWWNELGPARAIWFGLFHSVSAFNNAGFALWSDNLTRWRADWTVNMVITGLIIVGGLGFFCLSEVLRQRRLALISVHTKVAVAATGILLAGGTIAILLLEWNNPRTLAKLGASERFLAAWFQSVTARTAGFNTIDNGALTTPALFVTMTLMFVGASPGGTGGGVKTTTFSIIVAALWTTVRGGNEPHLFGRRLSTETVSRAFFVSLIAFLMLNGIAGITLMSEGRDLMQTLFETTSAFGTVGLSMGFNGSTVSLSGFFTPIGKLMMMLMMFIGRLGPLTLAIAVARSGRTPAKIRYPEGKVLIG